MVSLSVAQYGCEDRPPGEPTPTPSAIVIGHVVDAVDSAAVVDARLTTSQGFSTRTAIDGSFRLPVADGVSQVEIEARGYWTRSTRVASNGAPSVEIDLLPDGKGFNLPFFDYVFRQRGECNPNGLATVRWLQQPVFEVWLSEFACQSQTSTGGCRTLRATGRPAPARFVDGVRQVLTEDITQYTGGALTGTSMVQRDFQVGTPILHPNDTIKPGTITVAYVDAQGASIGAIDHAGELGMSAGHVQLLGAGLDDILTLGLASHEIAHTLGYHHPCGGALVPLPSAMQMAGRPTDADRLHGRVLYRRPSNSRSPDIDSNSFVVNAK